MSDKSTIKWLEGRAAKHDHEQKAWLGENVPTGTSGFHDALAMIKRLREQRNKLAEYVRRLWAASCYEWGDEFQRIGEELGVCELRPVVPGSDDAEEWGEDAELYYLAPWVIGGEDE